MNVTTIHHDAEADRLIGSEKHDSRYPYDTVLCGAGWEQYDTQADAWYYGKWVNIKERKIFTYAEGDRCLIICADDAALKKALEEIAAFHGPPPPAFITYDQLPSGGWQRTEVYAERPAVKEETK